MLVPARNTGDEDDQEDDNDIVSWITIGNGKPGQNVIERFDCYGDHSTLGTRWSRWLKAFELFADASGLILNGETTQGSNKDEEHSCFTSQGRTFRIFSTPYRIPAKLTTTKVQSTR